MSISRFLPRHLCMPLVLVLLGAGSAETSAQSAAKFAGEFLAIGVGARPQSLGAAFAALADDGTATYWNPAGIGQIMHTRVSVMHAEQFAGEANYDFASVILPFQEKNTFGFSIIRLGIEGIPDTRNALIDTLQINGRIDEGERLNVDKITFFSNTDYAFFFSFAHQKSENSFVGANIKLIRRTIGDNDAWGVGFDAALLSHIGSRLSFGINVMNATSTILVWNTGRQELISPTVKLGTAYTFEHTGIPFTATPVVDADVRFENRDFSSLYTVGTVSIDMHYGLEVQYRKISALRIGYDELERLSFGAGITLKKVFVDYSFTSFDKFNELGNSHRISLSLEFDSNRLK